MLDFNLDLIKAEYFEEKEVFLYDFTSFVSEFGRALGLFLGFSFFSCLDLLVIFFTACHKEKFTPPKQVTDVILAKIFSIILS